MSEDESSEPDVDLDIPEDERDPDMDEWWTWSNFARLFIVPLIIVVVSVTIYGFFQFMVRDSRAVNEYISQMKTGTDRARWRAAFDLAQRVQQGDVEEQLTITDVQSIIRLYKQSEEPKVRMYLARVLGHIPTPESRQALVDGLSDTAPGVRVNTTLALGQLEAASAVESIAKLLSDDRPEVRRMSAYVLGSLGNPEAVEPLKETLDDPVKDVRWNGAIALARLGDDTGKEILMKNLRLAQEGNFSTMEPETRANLLVNTIKALTKIQAREAVPVLETLREEDPAPSVRERSIRALEELRG
jgi:HEAT repeat protein